MITKAVILAAGFGTRLLPLTRVVPKPLLPLGGVPMLDRALAMVKSWGVRDVVINLHHGADTMLRHVLDHRDDGLAINISFEPEILGTGGALTKASWFFDDGEPFWIVNADVAADVDGKTIARAFRRGRTIAAAWLKGDVGPRTVECVRGRITNFSSKKAGAPGTYTFCGVHLVDPRILNYLPGAGFASIVPAYERAMADGWHIAGVPINRAWWADVGTPSQYVDACRRFRKKPTAGSNGIRIVHDVIIGAGVPDGHYAGIMALRAEDALSPAEKNLARKWSGTEGMIACPLAPRGSSRAFTRLYAGKKSAMLVTHDPTREENNYYALHARFLRKLGIPVPRVIAEDKRNHITVFEDVGSTSVQDLAPAKSGTWLLHIYEQVIDVMIGFHQAGYRGMKKKRLPTMRPLDDHLYAWEHNLFAENFLQKHCGLPPATTEKIKQELRANSRPFKNARPVLVHRDLQSSNIIVRGKKWSLIDFQGMREGRAVYDLASMLLDPYIHIENEIRMKLLERYADQSNPDSRVMELFWPAGIQRLGQALGAYARLGSNRDTERFLAYMPQAVRNMRLAISYCDRPMPNLSSALERFENG